MAFPNFAEETTKPNWHWSGGVDGWMRTEIGVGVVALAVVFLLFRRKLMRLWRGMVR
jgi:hypothetical protein